MEEIFLYLSGLTFAEIVAYLYAIDKLLGIALKTRNLLSKKKSKDEPKR